MHHLIVSKKACEDFLLQVSTIQFGSRMDLLRETPEQEERMNKLRLKFAQRLNVAMRGKQQLKIHQIFEGVIAASKCAKVVSNRFARCSPTDLYPPQSYVDLLDVLTHFGVSTTDRLQIIGYFAKDLDATTDTSDERKYFNVACSCLLNDHMSDAAMSEMQKTWSFDQQFVCIDRVCGVPETAELKRRSKTEGKPNKDPTLKFSPRPMEQTAQQSGETRQEFPHNLPAHMHTDESVFVEPAQSEDTELLNGPPRISHRRAKTGACNRCPTCKIHLHGPNANDHPNAHNEDPKKTFSCAVCGIVMQKPSGRNVHEKNQHGFIRDEADANMKAAVKIQKSQLARMVNVGTALVDVQRTAVPSRDLQAGEYANEEDLEAIVDEDPQNANCPR
ncbi:hypothetical protein M3Y99_01335400 [Aphelenchoides fujianensis]|nr:hypothetical protein M3Y99_01335400 [Aphelenchoides fujianensis]